MSQSKNSPKKTVITIPTFLNKTEKLYLFILKSGKKIKYTKLSKNAQGLFDKNLIEINEGMISLTKKGREFII